MAATSAGVAVASASVAVGDGFKGVATAWVGVAVGDGGMGVAVAGSVGVGGIAVAEGSSDVAFAVVAMLRSTDRLLAVVVTVSTAAASMLAEPGSSGDGVAMGTAATFPTAASVGWGDALKTLFS